MRRLTPERFAALTAGMSLADVARDERAAYAALHAFAAAVVPGLWADLDARPDVPPAAQWATLDTALALCGARYAAAARARPDDLREHAGEIVCAYLRAEMAQCAAAFSAPRDRLFWFRVRCDDALAKIAGAARRRAARQTAAREGQR